MPYLTKLEQAKQLVELDDSFCSAWSTVYTRLFREPERFKDALAIMDKVIDRAGLPAVDPDKINQHLLKKL